jgi:ABC-type dipeptide/oligopeptide/nickel transport system permease component
VKVILKRIVLLPVVLIGVALILFAVIHLSPTSPAQLLIADYVTPEVRANIEAKLGLDQPLPIQFEKYVVGLAQGDLGDSFRYRDPVSKLLLDVLPSSVALIASGLVVALIITLPLGFLAARFKNGWLDTAIRGFVVCGVSIPSFYLGIVLILVLGFYLHLIPISGRGTPPDFWHLIAPAIVLGVNTAGSSTRVLRAALLDSLNEDYIRAARARGINERAILLKLAGRNALVSAVTVFGADSAGMIGSVILVETVFARPGLGQLLFTGLKYHDFPLISGSILVLLIFVVAINTLVDVLHLVIDPRVRQA